MSRIGKRIIEIPQGVQVTLAQREIAVKGPKGTLHFKIPGKIDVVQKDGKILVTRQEEVSTVRALHGACQSVILNMVKGVTEGFIKELDIQGVGFRAEVQGHNLKLSLGFSHPVLFPIPEGIQVKVANQTAVVIQGFDKVLVGQVAANIRKLKPPEPYQGKGIRYKGEIIVKKVGKAAAGATGA